LFVFGLTVSLIGMGTVLFALVLLMGLIKTLGRFAALAGKDTPPEVGKRRRNHRKPAAETREPVAKVQVAAEVQRGDEIEVVIAAALAACLQEPRENGRPGV